MEQYSKNKPEDFLNNYFAVGSSSAVTSKSFIEVIAPYLKQWKWILVSVFAFLCLGIFQVMTTEKLFKSTATVLINEDKNKGSSSPSGLSFDDLGLLSSTSNIDNEVVALTSPDLMHVVVDSLNLATQYHVQDRFYARELFENSPFLAVFSKRFTEFPGSISFSVVKETVGYHIKGEYTVSALRKIPIDKTILSFPITMLFPDTLGSVKLSLKSRNIEEGTKYLISIVSPSAVAKGIAGALGVTQTTKNSTALKLEISVNNISKGNAILSQLVRQYNLQNNKANNEISYNTSIFINQRLKQIADELSDVEKDVVDYKQRNKIADLPSEAQLSIAQSGKNQEKLADAETQLSIINMVEGFVKDPANDMRVIPNLGVSDPALAAIISGYNMKVIASETLIKNTGGENPTRAKVVDEIKSMHAGIINSLKNVKRAYLITKNDALKMSGLTETQIQEIPQQERGLLERVRQQQVKENLFLFLMQKREETNISIASISEKARVVSSPQGLGPISPNIRMIIIVSLLLGLAIPIVVIYLLNLLRTHIADRSELERLTSISVIGQIAKSSDTLVMHTDPKGSVAEMFRALRNKLSFIFQNQDHKVVLVTSTLTGEGKTFMSLNLALTYTLANKKVLLIGGDVRKPRIKKVLNLKESKGLSDYLAHDSDNWKDYLIRSEMSLSLDILISGTVPPNPNELLMGLRLKKLLEEARQEYDMVVIDTAPVGMVSDTYLYSDFVDATVYIVRENHTPKTALQFVNAQHQEGLLKNMYLVLNDSEVSQSYGYKYGYTKGYGYGDSSKKKKGKLF